ncbi:nucleotide sugar dehydrogenase [Plantactinospora sp. GCM10030261]|uniref:nucleotide sugar dehydrogenase n=1 Tax=Plantactinospora sp. GCM10030261 TaxID=3273420 RepID=UPI003610E7D0
MNTHNDPGPVAVVGLGYVGLTLAVSLAREGTSVIGVEADPAVRAALADRRPTLFEPGVGALLAALPADRFTVTDRLPDTPVRAIVICVGTAVDPRTHLPDLGHLTAAVDHVATHLTEDTLVVLRSTVPVGTTRGFILARLRERGVARPLLAVCPERTIQGRALAELAALPQVIGGVDERSARRAADLLAPVAPDQVLVSSVEAAEMVKLVCNAHTDLIYGFGNEVALMARSLGVDASEVIDAANLRYPRPDLSRPGFVGGSCLTKDPYLLMHAARQAGYHPPMVAAARTVNERVPRLAVEQVLDGLAAAGRPVAEARVLVCGIAYKGRPATDDIRGSASVEVARALRGRVAELRGHDFVVAPERICRAGFSPVGVEEGLDGADAVVLLVDHPGYRTVLGHPVLRERMRLPSVVFDMWGVLAEDLAGADDIDYRRLGVAERPAGVPVPA